MQEQEKRIRTLIMGAGGRDFHNFNVMFRDDPTAEVVAFTATQIPGIENRIYPPGLAGPLYPNGIMIESETNLELLCKQLKVEQVVFAYSDITHEQVMHLASRVLSTGAGFVLAGPGQTMLRAGVPVISVTAVRTGCGKSQISRWISRRLREHGLRVAALRHPMPYGDLSKQGVQRFATLNDLDTNECTNEEREEYEPYIDAGGVVFAGVDYARIVAAAEAESDIIIWDGGNNDFSFLQPNLNIVVLDALRPGQSTGYHPGEAVLRMAEVAIINKVDATSEDNIKLLVDEVTAVNPGATIIRAASPVIVDDSNLVRGRRVLVVEDGPTITHGGMPYGAGYIAAQNLGAKEIVDPRESASAEIKAVFEKYPHIGPVLPAVGYYGSQLEGLRQTIERSSADTVLVATPFDLAARLHLTKPSVRARYDYADAGEPELGSIIDGFIKDHGF